MTPKQLELLKDFEKVLFDPIGSENSFYEPWEVDRLLKAQEAKTKAEERKLLKEAVEGWSENFLLTQGEWRTSENDKEFEDEWARIEKFEKILSSNQH